VNVESQRIQTDSIRFVLNGDLQYKLLRNDDARFNSFTTAITTQMKSRSLKDIVLLIGSADFSALNAESISGAWMVHARYNRKVNSWLRLEVFSQTQQNRVLDIRLRQLIGLGPRFKLSGTKRLRMYLGTLYMLENQRFAGADEKLTTKHRMSSYLSLGYSLPSGNGEFTSVTYYQPRLNDFSDLRLSTQTSLTLKISSTLSMVNSLNLYYESRPAKTVAKFNYMLENGLRLNL